MFCIFCGKKIAENSKFYKHCGSSQTKVVKHNNSSKFEEWAGNNFLLIFFILYILLNIINFFYETRKYRYENESNNYETQDYGHDVSGERFMNEIENDLRSGELDPSLFYD